ncbi:MAG: translocation/assembly module TamB domain-containing protein [Opitutaceae bacterium]
MRRRLLIVLGCLLAGVFLALATLPWWLGSVAQSVARRYGVEFKRYERIGYSRFAVHDVVVKKASVNVKVARAETETPLLWTFHHWFGEPAAVVATTWSVDIQPSSPPVPNPAPATPDGGAMRLRATLFKIANVLDRWLPLASVGPGAVTWKGGGLRLDSAEWKQRSLAVRPLRYGTQAADVQLTFTKNDELLLIAGGEVGLPWKASLESVRDEISGELRAWDQPAPVSARFAARGWMPSELSLKAEHWVVPGTQLKLGQVYSNVRGEAQLEWREGKFEASADVTGEVPPDKKAPPLVTKLHARGDGQSVTIDSLLIDIPGVNAKLDAPATFSRSATVASGPSQFTLEMDLEKQPWIPGAKGSIAGRARVTPVSGKPPLIVATIEARDVAVKDLTIARVSAATTFDWPRLIVKDAVLGFAEGGQLALRGEWNFQSSELVDVVAQGEVRPPAIRRWLPANLDFESLKLAVKAHGPIAALQHEGTAQLTRFTGPRVNPLAVDVGWGGVGAAVQISNGRIRAKNSLITLTGKLDAKSARLETLKWEHGDVERFALVQPATIRWSPKLEVETVQLRGPEASITLAAALGESGKLDAAVRDLPSVWLADFVEIPGPDWRLTSFEAQSSWDRGPATFLVNGALVVTLAPERFANVMVAAQNDGAGVKIESLRVLEGEAPIVNASGRLPVAFYPGTGKFLRFEENAPLALQATTASNPTFWKKLTEATGLEFQEPEVNANLSGTWGSPQGEVIARAARLAADPQRIKFPFPTVEALDLHVTADGKGLQVHRLAVQVEGQTVRANGSLPLTVKQWPEFKRAPVDYLRREGNLRLEIPDAEVAAFSRYVGQYLAPAGRLHIDLTMSPGGEMAGALRLQDAATRPLGPLGVLQEVQADAQLVGRNIVVKNVAASAGGQPVTLSGKVEVPVGEPLKFDLSLVGENFPLVRQTGLLMRADLDLKLTTQADNITNVTGAVNLRDSMFLSDVRALIPKGGGGGPARRPPFFSIESPPLDSWRLSVEVRGDQFLRLRSAVFVGVASARFHLGGTLGEPRATGEAVVDSGQVLLPFASFRVEQGTVRLTESDPYSLQLFLAGTSRRYGYDLRMELTGTATEPVVTFSSSPPLDAKQVLLMVTAGEVPHDTVTYGATQRAAKLGTYLGQSLFTNLGGDASEADRFTLSTGERVTREGGKETYNIEYRINDRLTAVVDLRDEFDEKNIGLKWRLFAPKPKEKKEANARPPVKAEETDDAAR